MNFQEYHAITHNEVWRLGVHKSFESADYFAVDHLNLHQAPSGYVVVTHKELESIKDILDKRGVGVF